MSEKEYLSPNPSDWTDAQSCLAPIARKAMDELYQRQSKAGFVNTCCYDFGIPAVVRIMGDHWQAQCAEMAKLINDHSTEMSQHANDFKSIWDAVVKAYPLSRLSTSMHLVDEILCGIGCLEAERDAERAEAAKVKAELAEAKELIAVLDFNRDEIAQENLVLSDKIERLQHQLWSTLLLHDEVGTGTVRPHHCTASRMAAKNIRALIGDQP